MLCGFMFCHASVILCHVVSDDMQRIVRKYGTPGGIGRIIFTGIILSTDASRIGSKFTRLPRGTSP